MAKRAVDLSAFCGIAVVPPPDGVESNLIDPPTLTASIWAVSMVMLISALFFLVARVFVNIRKLSAPDCGFLFSTRWLSLTHNAPDFAIIAMVFSIAYSACEISTWKWQRHIYDIPLCWINQDFIKVCLTWGYSTDGVHD